MRWYFAKSPYLFCGLRCQHDFYTQLERGYYGYLRSYLNNQEFGENLFGTAGVGWHGSDGFFELLFSFGLQPSIVTEREKGYNEYSGGPPPPYGVFHSKYYTISLRWGFDL